LKRKIFTGITILILLICISFLLYRGHKWWQVQQKRKALFVYFQKNSPVTQRIPEDAFLYLNLFDFKRVHASLQDTRFYEVLTHWLDTGMSENHKANPLVGGMLETTILNVIGEEFAIALVPSRDRTPDIFAVAKLAPGSDLLLQLALSTTKNVRKIPFEEENIFALQTKLPNFPQLFVHVDELFAYACSNEDRIRKVHSTGKGPTFLAKLDVQAIPEDTFLFLHAKNPSFSTLMHGGKNVFHLKASSGLEIQSHLPRFDHNGSTVLQLQTNGTEALRQPAATYAVHSINDQPFSSLFLSFPSKENARRFEESVISRLEIEPHSLKPDTVNGLNCLRYSSGISERLICKDDVHLLLAQGEPAVRQAAASLKGIQRKKLPLTVTIEFRPEKLSSYFQKVTSQDWSQFPEAKAFYFLSCIKQIQGSIDGSQNEIIAEIH
jgi:hypothetical protein